MAFSDSARVFRNRRVCARQVVLGDRGLFEIVARPEVGPILALCAAVVLTMPAPAFAADKAECEKKAVDKNGKALAGAAKESSIKKCMGGGDAGAATSCEAKAVDKNGKPLAGAAKTSFMKKCDADSKKK